MSEFSGATSNRLFSLDVFRGAIMFLLIGEAAGFHESFSNLTAGTAFYPIAQQLHHHPWHGLRFWDVIQPFFMFIVGVAMPFSLKRRLALGNKSEVTGHIVKRCLTLFAFGVMLHCVYSHKLVWELWNVLVQLALTIGIAYVIMGKSSKYQLIVSFVLLALTEILYRGYNPEFTYAQTHQSFGGYIDLLTMGKVNEGYWVFINFLPTAAHTIWGVIYGQTLLSRIPTDTKIKRFLIWGFSLLLLGILLDAAHVTPIVKRIATSSFTLTTGGIAILTMTLLYWTIDIKRIKPSWLFVFSVVGTNSIFIYLLAETVGVQWFRDFGLIWTKGLLSPIGIDEKIIFVVNALLVQFMFWYITYFLNKHKIYFKI